MGRNSRLYGPKLSIGYRIQDTRIQDISYIIYKIHDTRLVAHKYSELWFKVSFKYRDSESIQGIYVLRGCNDTKCIIANFITTGIFIPFFLFFKLLHFMLIMEINHS